MHTLQLIYLDLTLAQNYASDVEQVLRHLLNNLNKTMDKTLGWDIDLKRRIVEKTCVNCSE